VKAIKFVGVLDSVDEACPVLADLVMPDWNLTMPLMNSAVIRGFEPEQIRALRREYRAMKNSGEFSRLFEIEETVYLTARDLFGKALARCKAARRDVDRRARLAPRHVHIDAVRFSNHNGRVERGRHVCPLADLNRHIIFGPYDRLDPGTYEVEFLFTTSNIPRGGSGVITLDATANRDNVLALRRFDAAALNGAGRRSLKIKNKNGSASFEYRLHAVGFESGAVEFHGVIVRRLSALNSLRSDLVGMFEKIRAWDRRLGSSGGRIAGPVAAHRMLGEREPA
jgi:hypothetical protein